MNKTKNLLAGILVLAFLWVGMANADYTLNMPVGVTKISREVHDLHMLVIWICLGIGLVVFSVMFYSFYHHRKSCGAVAASFHENGMVEILWTLIPFIILIGMAIPATRTMMDRDELIARGEEVYNGNCASCHQASGEGIPGAFQAIQGSAVTTGALDKHIDLMLNGKGMMPSFSAMLSAPDLAAVITYQRNAFGNNVGDFVQPSEIAPLIKARVDDEDEDE